ncbi:MAG: hypothetical protein LOD92_08355, partial [Bacillales bacterium]
LRRLDAGTKVRIIVGEYQQNLSLKSHFYYLVIDNVLLYNSHCALFEYSLQCFCSMGKNNNE